MPLYDLLIKVGVGFGAERKAATHHGIKHHTETPNVYRLTAVLSALHDLRRHVRGGATKNLEFLVLALHTESKVDEFRIPVFVKQHIFELDIAMDNCLDMHVLQALCDLTKNAARFVLVQLPLRFDVRAQIAGAEVFHHKVDAATGLNRLEKSDHQRVIKMLHEFYFLLNSAPLVRILYLRLLVCLDRHMLPGQLVSRYTHFREGTDAYDLAEAKEVRGRSILRPS